MERETIKLDNSAWADLALEDYLSINGEEVEIQIVEEGYGGSRRHTECHYKVFKRLSDNKFFRIDYETSLKDTMGWEDCNCGSTEAVEVFPKEVTITTYE